MAIYKISENSMRIEYDFIPKQKIRDKIKEIENEVKQMEQADIGVGFTLGEEWKNKKATIQAYKDLLKE